MKTGQIFNPKEEKQERMKKFEVIDGGLAKPEGKEPPMTDWLTELTDNTAFLACKKGRLEVVMTQFRVVSHSEKHVELREADTEQSFWVNPGAFCSTMKLMEVLEKG